MDSGHQAHKLQVLDERSPPRASVYAVDAGGKRDRARNCRNAPNSFSGDSRRLRRIQAMRRGSPGAAERERTVSRFRPNEPPALKRAMDLSSLGDFEHFGVNLEEFCKMCDLSATVYGENPAGPKRQISPLLVRTVEMSFDS
ncbi:hypothetical protein JCGZ_04537 [Jatropha curcas]|uniref:Uncharacterized protein n=1 Tax=Jatropha curcas TaxID=180498 RepID=A0A067LGX7_JATCU|nr:hypothetical protein JCGZ_04537 [Jatropha curcas]